MPELACQEQPAAESRAGSPVFGKPPSPGRSATRPLRPPAGLGPRGPDPADQLCQRLATRRAFATLDIALASERIRLAAAQLERAR